MERREQGLVGERAPGEDHGRAKKQVALYLLGLVLALSLTSTSFWAARSGVLWGPGIPIGLCVLAVAQMGIHLVFFLHITSGPDNTNNVLALAFGVLIVFLVVIGSIWIMSNLNNNMMAPMGTMNAAYMPTD
jgi:cytochrome o ubiquinol oxidase subunit IV